MPKQEEMRGRSAYKEIDTLGLPRKAHQEGKTKNLLYEQ
jgi:hypothetical protein